MTYRRHGRRNRIYRRKRGWPQRSTTNSDWDNDYYHAAPGTPQGPPKRAPEVTTAFVTLMSLNEPGALYDATKALDLQNW